MKKFYLTLLFSVCIPLLSSADELQVKSFKKLPNDISARRFEKFDANDERCAIVKVLTNLKNLSFESNLGIIAAEQKTGEYWIYISPGERRLRFICEGFIPLDYTIPERIEAGNVYQMIITSKGIAGSEFTTGLILLKSNPPGANVYIDGEYKGTTPFQQELMSGYYKFRLSKKLFYDAEGSFSVIVDQTTTEDILLKPNFGSVKITTTVENASVAIDDRIMPFTTPCNIDSISSGKHTLNLTKDLYEPFSIEFDIKDEETTTLEAELMPIFGNVEINTNPEAEIFIDKKNKGSGSWSGILLKGLHTIEAKKEKYYTETRKINIEAGKSETMEFILNPIIGSISVITDPPEAEILINGKSYGLSPKIINDLIIGTYTIVFKKDNYTTVTTQAEIKENERTTVRENLENFREARITSTPSGAGMTINGKSEGSTPKSLTLPFGKNSISLTKAGYKKLEQQFEVTEQKSEYHFTMVSDAKALANVNFKKYKRRKNWWLGGTIVSAGVGGYFYYAANKHYDEYKTATDNATDLHNKIKTEDIIWPTAFGVSAVCLVMTIINGSKAGKLKKQYDLGLAPVGGGAVVALKINF